MSYASPKINKRYAGKRKPTDKNESPKNSKAKQKRNDIVNVTTTTTAPVRIRPRSPTRTTVSVTIENRNSDVDGFSITAYLPQSGWKKLKVPNDHHMKHILYHTIQYSQLNIRTM